jgi:hypothetical protein
MAVEREPGGTRLVDVLDRVLDKGIVIDARLRVSAGGIDLRSVRVTVLMDGDDPHDHDRDPRTPARAVRVPRPRVVVNAYCRR